MVTDGMMAMLDRLIELCDGGAVVTGIEIVCDALMDYSEDGWYMMSAAERDEWLRTEIAANLDLGK